MVSEIGIGKGRFRKAFLSCLQMRHSQPDASERAIEELGDECVYCGISGTEKRLQFDHLWPQASGGLTIIGNIVPCCPTCNSDRRDIPWEDYLRESPRVRARRSPPEVGGQIRKISIYMERHGQANKPTIESVLTRDELRLREDFNLILAAVGDAALAALGHEKKAAVRFRNPEKLFQELVALATRFELDT